VGWNYRVIEFVDPHTEEPWRGIFEVYYDDEGRPNGYLEEPSDVVSYDSGGNEAPGGLAWVLDRMREALERPVLVEKDFFRESREGTALEK
jgi:hypothetical protein